MLRDELKEEPNAARKALVMGIAGSARRMQELINDLRQLALTSGRISVIQAVDLSHHAALVLLTLRERDPDRNVLWQIEPGLTVHGDPSLIRIALENLLGNAWKFTLGADPAEITIRRGAGDDMAIEISDNGCGFDPAKADRLFEPFFRMHDDAKYPGSGLGLSIVKRVMSRHGGKVSVTSRPGQGTTFRLTFPMGFDLP
jgi:signal transduction histidine kinase